MANYNKAVLLKKVLAANRRHQELLHSSFQLHLSEEEFI